ncbi:MAG: hypothetical protein ABIP71_06380 [Verrucomicrobiota bacterium]
MSEVLSNGVASLEIEGELLFVKLHGDKKFENFQAAVALNFAYYNFCRTHGASRLTPTMAAG